MSEPLQFLRGARYVASFPSYKVAAEQVGGPLIAMVGRSNSGKSTLLSALCDHVGLAKASQKAGKTRMLNYFEVPQSDWHPRFHLVDLPGYGYAALPRKERLGLRKMVDTFLLEAEETRLVILVLDARRELESEELGVMAHAGNVGRLCILARTKWDRLNAKEKREARSSWRKLTHGVQNVPVSSPKRHGIRELLTAVQQSLH